MGKYEHPNQRRGNRILTGVHLDLSATNVSTVTVSFVDDPGTRDETSGREVLTDDRALRFVAACAEALSVLHDEVEAKAVEVAEPGAVAARIAAVADADRALRAAQAGATAAEATRATKQAETDALTTRAATLATQNAEAEAKLAATRKAIADEEAKVAALEVRK